VGLLQLEPLLGPGAAELGTRALGQALQAALAGTPGDGLVRASILCGPAARAGLPFTTLVTGGDVPLVTGRGGLGARLASLGLAAVFVVGPSLASAAPARRAPSPRLAERARAGTFELFGAFAARGELSGRNYASFLSVEEGRAIAAEASADRSAQHGCKGCPTPCGLVFERPGKGADKQRGGARFSATWALGPNLGFAAEGACDQPSAFRAALALLERCDDLGLDAREAGACLALLSRAAELGRPAPVERGGGARFGDLERLSAALDQLPPLGSGALAAELGLAHEHFDAQGQAARPEGSLASVLGQVVSTGGNDPLRAFPFTVARGRFDPREPAGKGRLVAWHEDLAAALDLSGFCGFSAAGLLVDGVLGLDELATWILPELGDKSERAEAAAGKPPAGSSPSPGAQLLEAGRCLVLARRAFNEALGRIGGLAPADLPAWSRAALLAPGMLDEYLAERGLDGAGRLAPATRSWLAGEHAAPWPPLVAELPRGDEPDPSLDGAAAGEQGPRPATALGEVTLLGAPTFELPLPAPLAEVLAHAASARPGARDLLFDPSGRPLPATWRERRPVAPGDLVHPGDRLDLLLAIAGG
ncbi:MAG: aldehyde ferredoxin oxidoreductase C-terminal domain-containing protein, partial [Planctomycetota bacterium]|nr:aldehyde ferredoxin oxidoreductase C-terminal domain-containing protein [Planctomycetota bacterium]